MTMTMMMTMIMTMTKMMIGERVNSLSFFLLYFFSFKTYVLKDQTGHSPEPYNIIEIYNFTTWRKTHVIQTIKRND